jgi:hypothetical protein
MICWENGGVAHVEVRNTALGEEKGKRQVVAKID